MKKRLQILLLIALVLSCVCAFACKNESSSGSSDSSDSGYSSSSSSSSGSSSSSSSSSSDSSTSGQDQPAPHVHDFVLSTQTENGCEVRYACECGANGSLVIRLFTAGVDGAAGTENTFSLQNGVYSLSAEEYANVTSLSVIYEGGLVKKIFCKSHSPELVDVVETSSNDNVIKYTLTDCVCDCCGESCFDDITVVGLDNNNDVKTFLRVDGKYELARANGDFSGLNKVEVCLTDGENVDVLFWFDAGYWTPFY